MRVKTFNEILRSVARVVVGRTKPRKTNRTPMTPRIKTLVKKSNMLRRNVKTRREEWLEACRETKEAFKEEREEKWIEYLDELVQDQDYSKMWKVVGSLNGRPDSTPANEPMLHNGKTITSNMKKADIFMSLYSGISRLSFSREERVKNRLLKTWLRAPTVDEESTADFSMEELKRAIKHMKTKGTAGPHDIPPTFLKALGQEARSELLTLFNMSFNTVKCPQEWQNAVIIPLLKAGKPSSKVASFRPVSLTSCIVKTLARMIAARIS